MKVPAGPRAWSKRVRHRWALLLCVLTTCLPGFARHASICPHSGIVSLAATCSGACAADANDRADGLEAPEAPGCCCRGSTAAPSDDGPAPDGEDPDEGAPCCRDVSLEDASPAPAGERLDDDALADADPDGEGATTLASPTALPAPRPGPRLAPATGPPSPGHALRQRLRERASVELQL